MCFGSAGMGIGLRKKTWFPDGRFILIFSRIQLLKPTWEGT